MDRRMRVSVCFIKKDHGSGKQTWREANVYDTGIIRAIRRLPNKRAKKAWFRGSSIKAY